MTKVFIDLKHGSTLVASDKVAIGAASAQSAAFAGDFEAVIAVLEADAPCQFEIGANPTADANSRYLPAGVRREVRVMPGQKLAVIEVQ